VKLTAISLALQRQTCQVIHRRCQSVYCICEVEEQARKELMLAESLLNDMADALSTWQNQLFSSPFPQLRADALLSRFAGLGAPQQEETP
jgi:hypothetical protein